MYIYDNYSQNVYNEVSFLVIDFMINSRHFLKFRELYNKLLELYKLISQEESIKKLYPDIIEWCDINNG